MRGKGIPSSPATSYAGITPAYAGKSSAIFVPEKALEDHPRLCGEKWSISNSLFCALGSPPPMRGKVRRNR